MASPKVGETRPLPPEDVIVPGKRPKLDTEPEITAEEKARKKQNERSRKLAKKNAKKLKKAREHLPDQCSPEDVQWRDIVELLGQDVVDSAVEEGTEFQSPFAFHEEVELEVKAICPNGDGLAQSDSEDRRPWVVIVPFSLPGERVKARIYKNARMHSMADFIEVLRPNPEMRDDSRVKCRYFSKCGGCQYQMLSYETQLDLKRDVVIKAYKNFSNLPQSVIPTVQPTIGSPLQYGYRTKITPHFQAPPPKIDKAELQKQCAEGEAPDWLQIGFNHQGTSKVIDIEECPIATPVLNEALPGVRENIVKTIHTYKRGATLLLRETLDTAEDSKHPPGTKLCNTSQNASIREKVGDFTFEYVASSFFQNNNVILPALTSYVRDAILALYPDPEDPARPTHLIDTYCGSGLFAITLSPNFSKIAGIEISADSILYAKQNARLNDIPSDRVDFRKGDASDIFQTVSDFPPEKTVMVIDPPRKGCDDAFIQQLLKFRCKVVVYVSCNVHTQARDVGKILKATEGEVEGSGRKYVLESLRGFDLFPQTAHVESVAILKLV
ncbi:tRNA methyltransferase [Dendrothele bispora CBS 962.96]|uniref:tRNA methyltransferase n=1 Tax=Dendrothele bispora (strain CBS 962.96) TaxID=1314807 RepID=A0A4S8MKN8_DENBC|nr:tRNA methyltransferase [Dendrothele bispora CBS 962.96]